MPSGKLHPARLRYMMLSIVLMKEYPPDIGEACHKNRKEHLL